MRESLQWLVPAPLTVIMPILIAELAAQVRLKSSVISEGPYQISVHILYNHLALFMFSTWLTDLFIGQNIIGPTFACTSCH